MLFGVWFGGGRWMWLVAVGGVCVRTVLQRSREFLKHLKLVLSFLSFLFSQPQYDSYGAISVLHSLTLPAAILPLYKTWI